MSWWDFLTDPYNKGKEAAFSRVFDGLIESRNAVRSAFAELENAKGRLAEFYVQFTALEASQQRSEYRRLYQDTLSELNDSEKRLDGLSADVATVQEAASAAYAGTRPYEMIAGEVAVAGINTRGLEPGDIEAGERRLAGIGVALGTAVLIALVWAIAAAATAWGAVAIDKNRGLKAANLEIARIRAAQGMTPEYIEDGSLLSDVATTAAAGVSIAIIGLVGLVGWWLAKRV